MHGGIFVWPAVLPIHPHQAFPDGVPHSSFIFLSVLPKASPGFFLEESLAFSIAPILSLLTLSLQILIFLLVGISYGFSLQLIKALLPITDLAEGERADR